MIHASLVTQVVKNLPAMQEAQVQSLGWEDPLEKEMAAHSRPLDMSCITLSLLFMHGIGC